MIDTDRIKALIEPMAVDGTLLELHEAEEAVYQTTATKFGGVPWAESGEIWPLCGTCGRPMDFIAQLNLAEAEHKTPDRGLYTFFYCLDCMPWGHSEAETLQWELRRYAAPDVERAVTLPGAPIDRDLPACIVEPEPVRLVPAWEQAANASNELVQLCMAAHLREPWEAYERYAREAGLESPVGMTTLGGHAAWIQGADVRTCGRCGRPMQLLAQIDSDGEAELMWGDCGMVYLQQCPADLDVVEMVLQCY